MLSRPRNRINSWIKINNLDNEYLTMHPSPLDMYCVVLQLTSYSWGEWSVVISFEIPVHPLHESSYPIITNVTPPPLTHTHTHHTCTHTVSHQLWC